MKVFSIILFMFSVLTVSAQQANSTIKTANDVYRKGDYKNAAELYKKALLKDAKNSTAKFNLGNALQKQNINEEAEKYYNEAATATDVELKAKALYNKGVAQAQQQKLTEAIEAFKESLTLAPYDNDARENLQKVINELKKKQQSASQQSQQNQQKPQQDKNKNKPPDKQMLEQKFNELRDKEKQLQKMLLKKGNLPQPDKDW